MLLRRTKVRAGRKAKKGCVFGGASLLLDCAFFIREASPRAVGVHCCAIVTGVALGWGALSQEKKKKKKVDIPHDFELHDYLAIIQGETTGEIIELPVAAWAFLECALAVFYLIHLIVPP